MLKFICTLFFIYNSIFLQAQYTDGAEISLHLSTNIIMPQGNYYANGNTTVTTTPQPILLVVKKENTVLQRINITPNRYGNYNVALIANNAEGQYKIIATGADGKKSTEQILTIINCNNMARAIKTAFKNLDDAAKNGLAAANNLANNLPPNAALNQYNATTADLSITLNECSVQYNASLNELAAIIEQASKVPEAFELLQPAINQLNNAKTEAQLQVTNFEQRRHHSETLAENCDKLHFLAEAATFVMLSTRFTARITEIFKQHIVEVLKPDIIEAINNNIQIEGRTQLIPTGGTPGAWGIGIGTHVQNLTAILRGYAAVRTRGITKAANFARYITNGVFASICQTINGTVTGSFNAQYIGGGRAGISAWETYTMGIKATITLRYGRGGNAANGYAVTGEIEGIYDRYNFWEAIEKIEPFPAGMRILRRDRISPIPVDLSGISVPLPHITDDGNSITTRHTAPFNLAAKLGLVARQLIPGSFIVKVKGVVKDNKLFLKLDDSSRINSTNTTPNNRLLLVMINPSMPIPLVRIFTFAMAPARSIFKVGFATEQIFNLTTTPTGITAQKNIDNIKMLDSDKIRTQTKLNITLNNSQE